MPAPNKRFGEMAAGVIAQAEVKWNTVSDSSSIVQLNPPLRQAAASLDASGGSAVGNKVENRTLNKILTVRKDIKIWKNE